MRGVIARIQGAAGWVEFETLGSQPGIALTRKLSDECDFVLAANHNCPDRAFTFPVADVALGDPDDAVVIAGRAIIQVGTPHSDKLGRDVFHDNGMESEPTGKKDGHEGNEVHESSCAA
ncbi:hypothetical protein MASR1M8_08630 [Thermomonas brevis]